MKPSFTTTAVAVATLVLAGCAGWHGGPNRPATAEHAHCAMHAAKHPAQAASAPKTAPDPHAAHTAAAAASAVPPAAGMGCAMMKKQ